MKRAVEWAAQIAAEMAAAQAVDENSLLAVLNDAVRRVQADAAADMRERAALACVPDDPDCGEQWIPERRECAQAIRALPVEVA